MLRAGQIALKHYAGISNVPNGAVVQSTCSRTGPNTAPQGMAVCKSVASLSNLQGTSRAKAYCPLRVGLSP